MSTGPTARKPTADIYTLLLVLALLALIVATVFLYLETNSTEYGSPPFALLRVGPNYGQEFRLAGVDHLGSLGYWDRLMSG